jgi:formylglycine-generating enzyme required for sulfatase activity
MRAFYLIITVLSLLGSTWPNERKSPPDQASRAGKDHALFFPVATYDHPNLTPLDESVTNAEAIALELEKNFGFSIEIIPNATGKQVVDKLKEYHEKFADGRLPADGQLFLYFSGHGMREFNNGYFLPANADPNSLPSTAIGYHYWRQFVSSINCQHIMVAIDACYSVTFDPDHTFANFEKYGRKGELTEAQRTLANHAEFPARVFFTSDSKEDKTPGRSNFARKLLQGLRELRSPDGFITSSRLFSNYVELAQPAPRAADFEGDDPSAAFLFFHQVTRDIENERTDLADWRTAEGQDNCAAYRTYLQKHPYGDFAAAARTKTASCDAEDRMIAAWTTAKRANDCDAYAAFEKDYPTSPYVTAAAAKKQLLDCNSVAPPDNMVFIKGGTFQMGDQFGDGSSDEKPIHAVTLSDFYLSRTEIMVGEFADFIEATGYTTTAEKEGDSYVYTGSKWKEKAGVTWRDDTAGKTRPTTEYSHPVIHVSWYDAVAYCNWLSEQHGLAPVYRISGTTVTPTWSANGYRLPTEAEWEYAARSGGKKEKWAGTSTENELTQFANYSGKGDGYDGTAPVGMLRANNLGLADMSGNVWEWCWDWYGSDYYGKPIGNNPKGPDTGAGRVLRGGSWRDYPAYCRAALRGSGVPTGRFNYVGFRLARSSRQGE